MVTVKGVSGEGRAELTAVFGAGRRVVSVADAAGVWATDRAVAAKRLARWAESGWVRRVRQGLYLAVPVDASDPASWTEDPWYLADIVWSPCYVTGWTAANHWSLTDQVFRSTIVVTAQRVRRVVDDLAGVPFVVHHQPESTMGWGLVGEWRHDRRVKVASPERAVVEMLARPSMAGGVRHLAEIIDSYLASSSQVVLIDALDRLSSGAAYKRLGYLVEALNIDAAELTEHCQLHLTEGFIDLDPDVGAVGRRSNRWRLKVNIEAAS